MHRSTAEGDQAVERVRGLVSMVGQGRAMHRDADERVQGAQPGSRHYACAKTPVLCRPAGG